MIGVDTAEGTHGGQSESMNSQNYSIRERHYTVSDGGRLHTSSITT